MVQRFATAVWKGPIETGAGTLSFPGERRADLPYSFESRFQSGAGTNPEELLAAAHAGCFAMALSGAADEAGCRPEQLEVTAAVSLANVPPKGWTITASHLELAAKIPDADAVKFAEIVAKARATCPVSRLLNATITLAARRE
jgi:osmotically inducible protein OsmC